MCSACSYERSEVEFRYNNSKDTKTFYNILLKMIRENPLKFNLAKCNRAVKFKTTSQNLARVTNLHLTDNNYHN